MEPTWSHQEMFPIIARIIESLYQSIQLPEFVAHEAIVEQLLQDAEASGTIDSVREASQGEHSREWIAHNMVAWFSQRITAGESEWTERFDRQMINGKWAYKPVS